MSKHEQGSPYPIFITEQCVATNNQHGLGKSQEEGEIWVRGRHKQEAERATTSIATSSSKRVPPREARGAYLTDKHGKKAQGETQRKQEQLGQYIYYLKLNSKHLKYLASYFRQI